MFNTIKKVIAEAACVELSSVTEKADLYKDLNLDDGDIDDIISEVADRLSIELYGYNNEFTCVSDIIDYVRGQLL